MVQHTDAPGTTVTRQAFGELDEGHCFHPETIVMAAGNAPHTMDEHTMSYSKICPLCRNLAGNLVLEDRCRVPTLHNTTLATKAEATDFPTGALHIVQCASCSFVWNAAFDENIISYDEHYNNDVSLSDFYNRHLEAMAAEILAAVPAEEPIHYVEIGCGQADFMRLFMERAKGRCLSATGFDPSFTSDAALPDNAAVHKFIFTPEHLDLVPPEANVICSRHTIEHVADVQTFCDAICTLVNRDNVHLFLETPDANWIVENVAFQDFFYEHCSLYTPKSISKALCDRGLKSKVSQVYGGQYMWVSAVRDHSSAQAGAFDDTSSNDHQYVAQRTELLSKWTNYVLDRQKNGKVALWGAASKGVTFALLLTSSEDLTIDCAVDLNTAKQNRFLPISGIQVVSPEAAMERGVDTIIIMNPNYEDEIRAITAELGWTPELATFNK